MQHMGAILANKHWNSMSFALVLLLHRMSLTVKSRLSAFVLSEKGHKTQLKLLNETIILLEAEARTAELYKSTEVWYCTVSQYGLWSIIERNDGIAIFVRLIIVGRVWRFENIVRNGYRPTSRRPHTGFTDSLVHSCQAWDSPIGRYLFTSRYIIAL